MIAVLPPSLPLSLGGGAGPGSPGPRVRKGPRCGQWGVRGGAPVLPHPVSTVPPSPSPPASGGGETQRRRAQLSGKWPLRPVAPPTAAVRSPRDRTREAAAAGQAHARANSAAAGARARAREEARPRHRAAATAAAASLSAPEGNPRASLVFYIIF